MIALFCLYTELILFSQEVPGVITHPLELQKELHLIQLSAPASANMTLEFDSGVFFYLLEQECSVDLLLFSKGLRYKTDDSGSAAALVRVFEDVESRETLYLNADNEVIFRIPPPYGYNPFWVLEAYYPDFNPPEYMRDCYDPARVIMRAVLLPFRINSTSGKLVPAEITHIPAGLPKTAGSSSSNDTADGKRTPHQTNREVIPPEEADLRPGKVSTSPYKLRVTKDIYVDAKNGDDGWSGLSRAKDGENGPKRSIAGSLKVLNGTGRLFVADGRYTDKINIRGQDVEVQIDGVALLFDQAKVKPE